MDTNTDGTYNMGKSIEYSIYGTHLQKVKLLKKLENTLVKWYLRRLYREI